VNHGGRYILDGKIPVPCEDLETWARWMEERYIECAVKQEAVGEFWVSTVFLGLDHNWIFNGPPMLFETMIFRSSNEEDARRIRKAGFERVPAHICVDDAPITRTSTWELALEDHADAVAWAKGRLS